MNLIFAIFVLMAAIGVATDSGGCTVPPAIDIINNSALNNSAMNTVEIWKDVKGFEGLYQVSNFGNVKSIERSITKTTHKKPTLIKERILKPSVNSNGYYIIVLNKSSIRITAKIHKLVAIAFLNHIPNRFESVINHKDFNKLNNNLNNLEIISNRENTNLKHIIHSSKYTGVSWNKYIEKWCAFIFINGKNKNLGSFENEYDAHLAYQNKLKEIING